MADVSDWIARTEPLDYDGLAYSTEDCLICHRKVRLGERHAVVDWAGNRICLVRDHASRTYAIYDWTGFRA